MKRREEDQRNLVGLWVQSREPGRLLRLLYYPDILAGMSVCDFGDACKRIYETPCALVERDGMRLMLAYLDENEEVVLFQYTLSGDTLELLRPPGERPEWWTGQNSYSWDYLVGKWFRVRIDQ